MGDTIDNIPGVPGVGEKTAVKLISQFGSVERLYENLTLVQGKVRETLATHREQAFLSRELATVSTRVPIAQDLDAFKRQEPDWERLRGLWTELEFETLLRQLPAAETTAAVTETSPPAIPWRWIGSAREGRRGLSFLRSASIIPPRAPPSSSSGRKRRISAAAASSGTTSSTWSNGG